MVQYFRWFPCGISAYFALLFILVCTATAGQKEIISFSEPVQPLPKQIAWNLQPTRIGLKCSIVLNLPTPKRPDGFEGNIVGEYTIEFDDMVMKQDFFEKPASNIEYILPFAMMANGEHGITLMVRDFAGTVYSQKRVFYLNASPEVKAVSQEKDDDTIDPVLTFSFWGEQDSNIGMVDIHLDERPLRSFAIKKEQNQKEMRLSDFAGMKLFAADLVPGNHLLKITAQGVNGGSSVQVMPLTVKAQPPVISIKRKDNRTVESIDIQFPPSSTKIAGSFEIYSRQSVILSSNSTEAGTSVSRAELLAALEKHNQEIGQSPLPVIISARAANQVENWQEISFQ